MKRGSTTEDASGRGEILADATYDRATFMKRTGLGRYVWMNARKQGLPVKMIGNAAFIVGQDWLDFVASRPSGVR
jgi:hypothetical protein